MRTALLIVFLALCLTGCAHASGAVTIEITTAAAGPRYTLHKRGYGSDMEVKTPEEIEAWLRGAIKQIGENEVIFIYADDHIPFRTVVDMLRRFKAAGVRRFAVCTGTGADVQPALSGNIDDLRLYGLKAK